MVFAEDFDKLSVLLKEHCVNCMEAVLEEIERGNGDKYLTNPAVEFTKLAKAGEFDEISDEEYQHLLDHVEEFSALWDGQLRETAWNLFCRWTENLRSTEEKRKAFAEMIVENSSTFVYSSDTIPNEIYEMEKEYDAYIFDSTRLIKEGWSGGL